MEFTIVSNEIQYIVIRNSKVAEPRRIIWPKKTSLTAYPSQEYERDRKSWFMSLNKSGKNAPMRLQSVVRTAVTVMNRLHRESGEERPEPIRFHSIPKVAFVFFQLFMVAVE